MAGLVPAIHVFLLGWSQDVDARDKPGHDETMLRLRDRGESSQEQFLIPPVARSQINGGEQPWSQK
jgi:hypothetical protein